MKKPLTALTIVLLPAASIFAQGPLAPLGLPGPTMKSLDQIASTGIPINGTNTPGDANSVFKITAPGSYYLTGNLQGEGGKDGILIEASNVSVNLNGFALIGVGSSLNGVGISRSGTSRANIAVRNGTITGFAQRGVYTVGAGSIGGLILEDLIIACVGDGIKSDVAGSTVIRRVHVRGGASGILCVGSSNQDQALDCQVTNTNGEGIVADVVDGCQVSQMKLVGFVAINAGRVSNTRVSAITGSSFILGIRAEEVVNCVVSSLSANGTLGVTGISADLVTDSNVAGLTGAGGDMKGIAAQTTDAGLVSGCNVAGIQTTGAGKVTGIVSGTVNGCHAANLGTANSTGDVIGIGGTSLVANCGMKGIGWSGLSGRAIGVVAGSDFNFLTSGTVSNVDVQNVIGSGMVMGIFANRIEQSTVHTISQSLSLGTKNFYGMVGEFLDGCKATALRASSAGARALSGNSVRDCNVSNAINPPFGITGIISNVVENCTVYLINGDGITATSDRGRVTGCQVCETVGYTGIKFVASSGIIENNSVNKASSGIVTDDTAKVLVRGNTVFDCPTKYTFGAATRAGPIINTAGSIVSTSPFANFSD